MPEKLQTEYDVPQGNVFESVFFCLYLNYITNHIPNCKIYKFADGTMISISGKRLHYMFTCVNHI